MRKFLLSLFAGVVTVAGAQAQNPSTEPVLSLSKGSGQAFPTRPIRVVVPFPAGGNVDTYIRQFARQMENTLGQPLVIDNRGGANGIVGCDIVAKGAPDGYTILATSIAFAINPATLANQFHAAVRKAFENAQLRETFSSTGYEPAAAPPAAFDKLFRADLKKYAEIVRVAKIEAQ